MKIGEEIYLNFNSTTCIVSNTRGGGTQLFVGEYVPRGFPKVGSRELVFLEK